MGPSRPSRIPRKGKPLRMRELAEARGLDLEESWAYSDSASDLPMLRAVGNPVVVNPDRELALVAQAEAWQIMRFETLGRRLKVAAAITAAAAAATAGRAAQARLSTVR